MWENLENKLKKYAGAAVVATGLILGGSAMVSCSDISECCEELYEKEGCGGSCDMNCGRGREAIRTCINWGDDDCYCGCACVSDGSYY